MVGSCEEKHFHRISLKVIVGAPSWMTDYMESSVAILITKSSVSLILKKMLKIDGLNLLGLVDFYLLHILAEESLLIYTHKKYI